MGSFSIWHWLILIILILPNLFHSSSQEGRFLGMVGGAFAGPVRRDCPALGVRVCQMAGVS